MLFKKTALDHCFVPDPILSHSESYPAAVLFFRMFDLATKKSRLGSYMSGVIYDSGLFPAHSIDVKSPILNTKTDSINRSGLFLCLFFRMGQTPLPVDMFLKQSLKDISF